MNDVDHHILIRWSNATKRVQAEMLKDVICSYISED